MFENRQTAIKYDIIRIFLSQEDCQFASCLFSLFDLNLTNTTL